MDRSFLFSDEFESELIVFTSGGKLPRISKLDSRKEYLLLCELYRDNGEREEWSQIIPPTDQFSKSMKFDHQGVFLKHFVVFVHW